MPKPVKMGGKSLPVAPRGTLGKPIPAQVREHPGAVYDKSCISTGVRPLAAWLPSEGMEPGPFRLGSTIGHFLFGKDGRHPEESAAGSMAGKNAGKRCTEKKFSTINQITS